MSAAEDGRSSVLAWLRERDQDTGNATASTPAASREEEEEERVKVLEIVGREITAELTQLSERLRLLNTRARLCQLQQSAEACFRSGQVCTTFRSTVGGRSVHTTVYPCYSKQQMNHTVIIKPPDAVVSIVELWDGAVSDTEGWCCAHKSSHPVEDTVEQVSLHTRPPRSHT